jgi:1,4-dihydroxy-2-naphthoate octaprenyltransferase
MASVSTWILASRPKTLFATIAPVLVGTAMAVEAGGVHILSATLCLLAAVLIQIGTNFHNDVADFEKGVDTADRSGPLRATAAGLVTATQMKRATTFTFTLAVLSGAYLMWRGGWPIVVIGASSILFGVLYTAGRFSLSSLGVADVFVFVFFGPVAVAGTYYIQALSMSPAVLLAGVAPGLLSVAILLVNNIRDVEDDREAGKNTLVVRVGRVWGTHLYLMCVVVAAGVPIALTLWQPAKSLVLIAVLAVPVLVPAWLTLRSSKEGQVLNPILARTAQVLMLYSILFSIGWSL